MSEIMAELWRGAFRESIHRGHAVVADTKGIVAAWGDPDSVILPRSSCKMLQALPLVESGAADAFGLGAEQLALACSSHQGAEIHTRRVQRWLAHLGLDDHALRCGPQIPNDTNARNALRDADETPCQWHNNCSGKHSGFLTLNAHMGGDADYIDPTHPVQTAVRDAFEGMTGETSPGYGIDGCSAPNFATRLSGLAKAMARMADPAGLGPARADAATRLVQAMKAHPDLVAGETRACTDLMRAMSGPTVVKTGAEGVFVAILPDRGLGVALKIEDGATRASECAMAALLVRLGVAEADNPLVAQRLRPDDVNRAGRVTGYFQPGETFFSGGGRL